MRQGVRFLRQQRGPLPVNPGELPLIGNALIEQSQLLLIRCDPFGLAEERGGVFMRVLRPQRGTCRSGLGFGALRVLSKFRDAPLVFSRWAASSCRCAARFSAFWAALPSPSSIFFCFCLNS